MYGRTQSSTPNKCEKANKMQQITRGDCIMSKTDQIIKVGPNDRLRRIPTSCFSFQLNLLKIKQLNWPF